MAGGKATYWTTTVGLCGACFLAILPSPQHRLSRVWHSQQRNFLSSLLFFGCFDAELRERSNIERHDVVVNGQFSNAIASPLELDVVEKLLLGTLMKTKKK